MRTVAQTIETLLVGTIDPVGNAVRTVADDRGYLGGFLLLV